MQNIFVQLGLGGIIQATCTSHKRACKNDMAQNRIVLVIQWWLHIHLSTRTHDPLFIKGVGGWNRYAMIHYAWVFSFHYTQFALATWMILKATAVLPNTQLLTFIATGLLKNSTQCDDTWLVNLLYSEISGNKQEVICRLHANKTNIFYHHKPFQSWMFPLQYRWQGASLR